MIGILSLASCVSDDNDELTGNANEGGLINVNNLLISYVVGNQGPYNASISLYQGNVTTQSVDIYKRFVTSAGDATEDIYFKTLDITNTSTSEFSTEEFDFTYSELIEGLTLNGSPLPTNDAGLTIGDAFILSYRSNLTNGVVHNLPNNGSYTSKVAVGTRLAGTYTIQQGWYIHPSTAPGLAGDYSEAYERVIESVALQDEYTVYKSTTMGWGSAGGWDDPACNFFYFNVNNAPEADGSYLITIPEFYNGVEQTLWCSDPIADCIRTPGNLPDVSCSNYVILDDASGNENDVINISYGYIRSSGTRQFDEILVKQ
ncbi:MAG: hypothetical protein BM564_10290 [Bacteroidetes bacterium MedPE-SWsnd-G2]|nr:MAG: hypothetical protein BM564_10290 [Bacteroidetes bacterium MedPE-SWsnd-G2]